MRANGSFLSKFRFAFIAEAGKAILGGVLIILLARLLDPEGYGLLFLAISILAIVRFLGTLGIGKSAARYITELKDKEPAKIPNIIRFSITVNIILLFIVSVLFYFLIPTISHQINEAGIDSLLYIGVLFVVFGTLFTYIKYILQGFEEIQKAAAFMAMDTVLRFVFVFVLVYSGYGASGALLGYIISYIITSTFGLLYLYIKVKNSKTNSRMDIKLKKKILEYNLPISLTRSSHMLDNKIDTILVGILVGPVGVSFYELSKQIVKFLETPMTALGFTLSPSLASKKVQGKISEARDMYQNSFSKAVLFYIPAAAGLIITAEPTVTIIFGSDYIGAVPVLQVLSIFMIVLATAKITGNALDYLGRARDRSIVKAVTSILNLILNLVLIPVYGVVGAAYATLITFSTYTVVNIYIINDELKISYLLLFKFVSYGVGIAVVMMTPVYFLLEFVSGPITLIGVIGIGALIWASIVHHSGLIDLSRLLD